MTTFTIRCPACGSEYSLDESHLGRKVKCAKCAGKFFIERHGQQIMARLAETPAAGHSPLTAETQVAAEWKVGDVILDLYEVKQIHEGGGMGLVYRVHHRGWNMDLAVKSPRTRYFQTEAQKENFSRECEAWINLGLHPHIVSCYYVRTLGGIPRVFAEYVEGGSLKDWIDSRRLYKGGPQAALERILDVAIQIAWGLLHAHEQGLIHQDVKPANVLVASDGTAKVSDFGLAKARVAAGEDYVPGDAERSLLVSCGGMTPAYCSPEQRERRLLTRRTDIWSWGLSVLTMFVGKVTWLSGLAAQVVLDLLEDLRVEGAGIPDPPGELVALLMECFAEDPVERPENFRVVAERLRGIYHGVAEQNYFRDIPVAAKLQADALNNRAVSLLDLGRVGEAERLFDEALALEPGHPQSVYNRGLHLWRGGRMTDDVLVQALEQSWMNRPDDWNLPYLLGWVQLERGELDGALDALWSAKDLGGGVEVQQALALTETEQRRVRKAPQMLEGHTEAVRSVALSMNAQWALSGSGDNTLRLWEVATGRCIRTFQGHTNEVNSVALSADGRWALSGGDDTTLRLWEVHTGRCLRVFEGHADRLPRLQ